MKYISIVRHGKSVELPPPADDFRRPLTDGGQKHVRRIAKILNRLEPEIGLVVSSPATRASHTATEICASIGYDKRVLWHDEIYQAGANQLLALLEKIPEEFEHIALIGHNPGLEQLISGLCAGVTDRNIVRLPTASFAHLHLEIFRWRQIRWGCAELRLLIKPKVLKKPKP